MALQDGIKDENEKAQNHKAQLFSFIKAEKDNGTSKTVIDLIKEYENDAGQIENPAGIYKELATLYPNEKAELLRKSVLCNKFIVRNTELFLHNIVNEDSNDNYKCTIFPPAKDKVLNFPCGTLSYIGARTSRGKTTAMISIIIDALHSNKNVAIITNEESTDEIQLRLITALMYTTKGFKKPAFMESPRDTIKDILKDILKAGNGLFNDPAPDENKVREYLTYYCKKALNELQEYYKNERLTIFDGLDAPKFNDVLDYIDTLPQKTVVVLDYIQHARTPAGFETCTRQMQIQESSHLLTDRIKKQNLICIAGAQFKRDGAYKSFKGGATEDILQDGLFRESGDIEQDGHINIGIGAFMKKGVTPIRYYSIFKNRGGSVDNKYFMLDLAGIGFSYIKAEYNGDNLQEYETPAGNKEVDQRQPEQDPNVFH